MIAIPIKTNKENAAVSTLFGKSKWFAYIDENGNTTIEDNQTESGREVVENMVKKGVDTLIFHHMGGNPFMLLQNAGIECYHNGGERILLDELLVRFKNGKLTKIDASNMSDFIEQGNMHKNTNDKHHKH